MHECHSRDWLNAPYAGCSILQKLNSAFQLDQHESPGHNHHWIHWIQSLKRFQIYFRVLLCFESIEQMGLVAEGIDIIYLNEW